MDDPKADGEWETPRMMLNALMNGVCSVYIVKGWRGEKKMAELRRIYGGRKG